MVSQRYRKLCLVTLQICLSGMQECASISGSFITPRLMMPGSGSAKLKEDVLH